MYYETKVAVKRSFRISKILFGMGIDRYRELLRHISTIEMPSETELDAYLDAGMNEEEAVVAELKRRYRDAALSSGFTEEQGIAMLEYTAMLKELNE